MAESNKDLVADAIQMACSREFGIVDQGFLCQSIGALTLKKPITVSGDASVLEVIQLLQANKIGSVLVVAEDGKLSGIFTERDCLLKVMLKECDLAKTSISHVMTKDPVAQPPQCTVAYALNLMSVEGFRHLPIVDDAGAPIAVLSVKDVVDLIVEKLHADLLGFETT